MKQSHTLPAAVGLGLLVASGASAAELVQNGGFEAGPQFRADFWTIPDLGTNADGDPNNYARVGNFAEQVGTDPNDFLLGPHGAGNGTGSVIPTRTVYLGGLNPRTSIIGQSIDTAGYEGGDASLTFKVVYEDLDVGGHDFFHVDFGPDRLLTIDAGLGYVDYVNRFGVTLQGGIHYWTLENPVIDLAPYLDGTAKDLTFTFINDATTGTSSAAWVDNVSINANAVPEPTTLAGLGLGALALLRRRRA